MRSFFVLPLVALLQHVEAAPNSYPFLPGNSTGEGPDPRAESLASPNSPRSASEYSQRDLLGLVGSASSMAATLTGMQPTTTQANLASATKALERALAGQGNKTNLMNFAVTLVSNGIAKPPSRSANSASDGGANSLNNNNPINPDTPIYPRKSPQDAPYSLSESDLRKAIHIPARFTRGQKAPVILVPGTGNTGFESFQDNFIKLLQNDPEMDPVWLNIPQSLLGNMQVNAEYVAYASNYISGISNNKKVAVVSWSQGGPDTQWAMKYWPSTRSAVGDFVPLSGDFHGTVVALLCDILPTCEASLVQQEYTSNFMKVLREGDGASALVPTTSVFSATDEIVQPQSGTGASAFLGGSQVTNNMVQDVCAGQTAGGIYTHEGVMYNPLAFALAVDAIKNEGPGDPSRLNLEEVCGSYLSPGLDFDDFVGTEGAILTTALNILDGNPVDKEPPIASYARRG